MLMAKGSTVVQHAADLTSAMQQPQKMAVQTKIAPTAGKKGCNELARQQPEVRGASSGWTGGDLAVYDALGRHEHTTQGFGLQLSGLAYLVL